jgi:hypothetical protein
MARSLLCSFIAALDIKVLSTQGTPTRPPDGKSAATLSDGLVHNVLQRGRRRGRAAGPVSPSYKSARRCSPCRYWIS